MNMKVPQEIREQLEAERWDNESVHGIYDKAMKARLKELDPEFIEDLSEITKGVSFWYG